MTLQEIIDDIHALNEDLEAYERKYGVLSETFYESYTSGEEPEDESWVLDWADWAGAYKIFLRRKDQYNRAIRELRGQSHSLVNVIERTLILARPLFFRVKTRRAVAKTVFSVL